MSAPGETNIPFDCGCDPEKVFELADGGLSVDQEREVREHLASCPGCRELYERERDLSACLGSLDFSRMPRRSVCQSVAMALPTRSLRARVLWGLLAGALLVAALVSLELHGREPVIPVMSILSACWGLMVGSTELTRAVFSAAGTTILLALALGTLADVLIALTVVFIRNRGRRVREA
ncbi:MAG: zf-HC2 domain-containing protein [Actinomycetota bacterium]|nr:zf-HC2 domain-containing protein [Actinomycetota bacterium]